MPAKLTHEEAVERIQSVHGNKITLISEYQSGRIRCRFRCSNGHVFSTQPYSVCNGSGCPQCRKLSHSTATLYTKSVHGNKVELVGPYKGSNVRHTFRCSVGHTWKTTPTYVWEGHGCAECLYLERAKSFVSKLRDDVELLDTYTKESDLLRFRCLNCGNRWRTRAFNAKSKCGCPKCAKLARRNQPHKVSHADFVSRMHSINPHIKILGQYTACDERIDCECPVGHKLKILPYVWSKETRECPMCRPKGRPYSKAAIQWLERESRDWRLKIRHAENGGEFRIPGTKYKVDGYNERYRLVFEFHGDYWHKDKSKTIQRMQEIKSLGYVVIYIWHSEFKEGKPSHFL